MRAKTRSVGRRKFYNKGTRWANALRLPVHTLNKLAAALPKGERPIGLGGAVIVACGRRADISTVDSVRDPEMTLASSAAATAETVTAIAATAVGQSRSCNSFEAVAGN